MSPEEAQLVLDAYTRPVTEVIPRFNDRIPNHCHTRHSHSQQPPALSPRLQPVLV